MDVDPIIALFKLGAREHMSALLLEGRVRMNPASRFLRDEGDASRFDPDEGIALHFPEGSTIDLHEAGTWKRFCTLTESTSPRHPQLDAVNLYCLHARRRSDYGRVLELDQLGFGDAFVLFLNSGEFLRRMRDAISAEGQTPLHAPVTYVDRRSHVGLVGPSRKFSEYAAQREFRVLAVPGLGVPLDLTLGDLSDIAIMGPTSRRLRIDPPPPESPA